MNRRAFFTFLLVLAFIPSALESMGIYHEALGQIADSNAFLIEQQRMSSLEHDFELSFWQTLQKSASHNRSIASDLASWRQALLSSHAAQGAEGAITLGCVPTRYTLDESLSGFDQGIGAVADKPDGTTVTLKESGQFKCAGSQEHLVVAYQLMYARTKSIYLIPGGSSRGIR